ncbi:MAG: sulfatase [Alphaproteobacteria bacterium]|nr:sulfatase [Alphaproteobacteria bacterium]
MIVFGLVFIGCGSSPPAGPAPAIRTATAPPEAIVGGKTNVVVVMLDTVRADHLGLYGYELPTSPALDALGAKSVVFDQHISNCSWTRPSMASMFTGLYPRTVGIYEEQFDRLDDSFTLLSERFDAKGYLTLGVTSNPNMNQVFGFQQGFDAYGESGLAFSWMDDDAKQGKETFGRETPLEDAAVMTDRALAIVDAHREPLATTPFYLQVVYIDPHWPYTQPPEHEAAVSGSQKPGYDGGIHFVDAELKRLLDGLEQRGLMQDTLLVITGDHGEGLWSHPGVPNSAWHGNTLYESVLHVPLLFTHPALEPHRVAGLTEGIDLVPTITDLMGWGTPDGLPGQSLAAAVRGEGEPPADRLVVSETDFRQNRKISVRTATHKLIRNDDVQLFAQGYFEGRKLTGQDRKQIAGGAPVELYPMTGNPELPRNSRPEDPEAAKLQAALEAWEARFPKRPPDQRDPSDVLTGPDGKAVPESTGGSVELDEATKKALEAIGYLDGADDAHEAPEP